MKDKATKKKEGEERNEAWRSLTPAQQLASLDARRVAAKRQRAMIAKKMEGR